MAMSGIAVHEDVKPIFENMKLHRKADREKQSRKMAFFRISDDKTMVISADDEILSKVPEAKISREAENDKAMYELLARLCMEQPYPLYVLFDFMYIKPGSSTPQEKLTMINWCPDSVSIKEKMVFTSTKENVKKVFSGLTIKPFDYHSPDDFDYQEAIKRVQGAK